MAQWSSAAEMNAQADNRAGRMVQVSFHSGDPGSAGASETAIPRESLTWAAAGAAGAHPRQVALDGRSWHQMLAVDVPDGVTVTHIAYRGSGGEVRQSREIPQVTGPLVGWPVSFPIVTTGTL